MDEQNNNEEVVAEVSEPQTTTNSSPVTESKGMSAVSMILGIVSILGCLFWYIGIPCGILAIIFGTIGNKQGGKGMATAGIVLGIISIALYLLLFLAGMSLITGIIAGLT